MSANLEEAINLVLRAEPDLHSIERTILKQFENPTEYYYDAIYSIVNHYGDLVPFNPIPTVNTFIRPGTQVHLVLSYSQEEFIASVIFLPDFVLEQFREAKSSHDLSQLTRNSFGEIRFSPQGEKVNICHQLLRIIAAGVVIEMSNHLDRWHQRV